ncbi:MAG: UPF0262 family protein [Rhizobiales bacterium]|nr:UPF0262 family protein [Hyphomicrobiales bacterium]NRB15413.1 UPF0262 family protein [Hyphomicrobiales bacterium]
MTDIAQNITNTHCLCDIVLNEKNITQISPEVTFERKAAMTDLLAENSFLPLRTMGDIEPIGPFRLMLDVQRGKLIFDIRTRSDDAIMLHILSLSPFRLIMKDYFLICERHHEAMKSANPQQIEAIDMGRRGLHNEGSTLLSERLKGKIKVDFETARRLYTLICALYRKG